MSGDYVITAVYADASTTDEAWYTVSVSVSTTTTTTTLAMITCDIEDCVFTSPYDPSDTAAAALHAYCDGCYQYKCNGRTHVEEQCISTNSNGDRCTYTFWRCVNPDVTSYGPSHAHVYPAPPAPPAPIFSPSVSLGSSSYSPGGSLSAVVTCSEPIYGAHLYVRAPGGCKSLWHPNSLVSWGCHEYVIDVKLHIPGGMQRVAGIR